MTIIAPVVDGELQYTYTDNSKKNQLNPAGSTLGYDQFLQLLCAEMQHQDPLEPTSNTDYVSQMATFSQLEATLASTETQQNNMANGLVGKQVILEVTSETTGATSWVQGKVDYVMYENGEVYLSVNDNLYPLESLDTIADSEYYEAATLAKTFTDMIDALPYMENLTVTYQKGIEQLREIYDGMTAYEQSFVSGEAVATLKAYEEKMAELVKAAEQAGEAETETPEGGDTENTEDGTTEGAEGTEGTDVV
uniref:flagellar hook capping FlgD N-terminal domain-containing protein n=1 Tax=Agathobacter sp. TaxID=2021311 RepID=UPI0040560F2D